MPLHVLSTCAHRQEVNVNSHRNFNNFNNRTDNLIDTTTNQQFIRFYD